MCRRTGVLVSVGVKNNRGLRCVPPHSHLKQNVCDVWRFPERPATLRLLQSASSYCFLCPGSVYSLPKPCLYLHVHGDSMYRQLSWVIEVWTLFTARELVWYQYLFKLSKRCYVVVKIVFQSCLFWVLNIIILYIGLKFERNNNITIDNSKYWR